LRSPLKALIVHLRLKLYFFDYVLLDLNIFVKIGEHFRSFYSL